MDLNIHNNNPVTCPRHSIQYQDYVRMQARRNNGAARGDNGSSVKRARSVNWVSVQQAEGPDSMLENILAELLDNYEVFRGMAALREFGLPISKVTHHRFTNLRSSSIEFF
jgi:hypothetical protein